jgi:vacuolar-type H+-ATPase subunit E/Vma4
MTRETGQEYRASLTLNTTDFLPPKPEQGSNAPSCAGGVVATSQKGKIRIINTLEERLKRVYSDSIPQIRSMLFES